MKKTLLASLTFLALVTLLTSGCKGDTPTTSQSTTVTSPEVQITSTAVTTVPITKVNKEPTMGNPLYAEMWRPSYHFTTKKSWINDPNGLTYFKGVYHIYYQTNPGSNLNGNIHWGHATSNDLVHFTEHSPVLFPDSSGHMWSGTTFVDSENRSGLFDGKEGGGIIAAYSTSSQKIGIAYSDDGFKFTKLGIVIDNTSIKDFRDPKLFYDGISRKWTMVVAGGKVRFYQSSDLRSWTLASENEIYTECPDFFPLKIEGTDTEMWVLTCAGRHAFVGEWNGTRFIPKSSQIPLNYGPDSYAGIIFSADREDRTLMLSWMNNWQYTQPADGIWAGANTLVHSLSLVKKGSSYRIIQTPVKEYESIYGDKPVSVENYTYKGENPFAAVNSQSYVLKMQIDLTQNRDFTLNFYDGSNDKVTLFCDASAKKITLNRSKSTLGIDLMKNHYPEYSFTLMGSYIKNGILDLEIYVDSSSVEVYALGYSHVLTLRTQPMTSSRSLSITAQNGLVIKSASVTLLDNIHFEDTDSVDAVHLSKTEITLTKDNAEGEFVNVFAYNSKKGFTAESANTKIAEVTLTDGGIKVIGKGVGSTYIKITSGSVFVKLSVTVVEKDSFYSELDNFTVSGGTLTKGYEGYTIKSGGGDAFALSDTFASDFELSADVSFPKNNGAAALCFRASDLQNFYCLCLDRSSGVVKIWTRKNGTVTDIKTVTFAYKKNAVYSVRIETVGDQLIAFIDGKQIISITDTRHTEGVVGINVFSTEALFNNIKFRSLASEDSSFDSMIESFKPIYGSVAKTGKGFFISNSSGDGFAVSNVLAHDFTYSAEVTVSSKTPAAALVFRMKDAGNFYCATIDIGAKIVKLWKKTDSTVTVVKTVNLDLEWNRAYKITVSTLGSEITISVDGKEVIKVNDSSHLSGYLGINVFNGSAYINNVEYAIVKE